MEEGEQLIGPKFKLKEHILFVIQTLVPNLVKTRMCVSWANTLCVTCLVLSCLLFSNKEVPFGGLSNVCR